MTQVQWQPEPSRQVTARLLNTVRRRVGDEAFTANSMLALVDLVQRAAMNMASAGEVGLEDLDRAEIATVRLLDELSRVAHEEGLEIYTEESVRALKSRLCPGFWPFC